MIKHGRKTKIVSVIAGLGATSPNPTRPRVADTGTPYRYIGYLRIRLRQMSSRGPTGDSCGGRGGASRWCCYFHEIPQKPDEGAVRRVRDAFITSNPTVFVGKTSKSTDYRKDTSNEKPVNNTPGQRVDGRPKPHQ